MTCAGWWGSVFRTGPHRRFSPPRSPSEKEILVTVTLAPAPPARLAPGPAGRVRAFFMVSVIMLMTATLGVLNPAPARAWAPIVIPAAKAVGVTAVSVLGPAAIEWALSDGTTDSGNDSDSGKRGKWSSKLKGIPGLATGVLGALWGATGLGDMFGGGDGVEMPPELAEDVKLPVNGSTVPDNNGSGNWRTWIVTNVRWEIVAGTHTVFIEATCTAGNVDNRCGGSSPQRGSVNTSAYFKCMSRSDGTFYNRVANAAMNSYPSGGSVPCYTSSTTPPDIPLSVELAKGGSVSSDGFKDKFESFNPNFDPGAHSGDGAIESVTAETRCVDGSGGTQTVSKTVSGTGVVPLAKCPTGWAPESTGWTSGTGEYLGGVKTKTPEAYPDCPPGACTRIIQVDGQDCHAYRPECYDWLNTEPPTRVKCEFGPYNMPLAECADLEHIHKGTNGMTWGEGPDGQPKWVPARPDGTPDPTRVGTIYAPERDPNWDYRPPLRGPLIQIGGDPDTDGPGNPDPDPPGNPDPTTVPIPPPVVNPPGGPKDVENPTRNCIAGMASWNPVDWVYTPVKCALTWAFIPPPGTGSGIGADFKNIIWSTGFGAWLGFLPDLVDGIPEGSGCMGPALKMPEHLGGETYYPLNACSEPMAKYAEMSRALISITAVFFGGISVINGLSTAFTGYRVFERETDRAVVEANKS